MRYFFFIFWSFTFAFGQYVGNGLIFDKSAFVSFFAVLTGCILTNWLYGEKE